MTATAFSVHHLADVPLPIPEGAGGGLTAVLGRALTRAGIEADAEFGGELWVADRWQAEIVVAGERKAEEAPFERGHHLLARLAEFAAQRLGGKLNDAVLRGFEDLATPSPAALLHYLAGEASSGAGRRRLWGRAFELDPRLAAVRTGLALELVRAGEPAAAAALLDGVLVEDGFVAAELGIALWAEGEDRVSLALLQAAVKADPQNALAMAALAAQLARRGRGDDEAGHEAWDEALLLATQATQLASDDFRTWAALAAVHRAGGDLEQAGFFYGFALRLEPDAPSVLKDAAACWLAARKPDLALPLIERARRLAPGDAEHLGNLAFARRLLREPDAALEAARQAASLAPADARLHILHGELALEAGRRDEALDAWARAAELEPGLTIHPEGGNLGLEAV